MKNSQEKNLQELTENLFKTHIKINNFINKSQSKIANIKAKYDPRKQFNNWRNSQEGKEWKKQKYFQQNKYCAICQERINNLKGSHIDHIKPISTHPHLALDTNNMRVTHGDCNLLKG